MSKPMANKVKMQHYVPRSYLQNFAETRGKSSPQVYCYSKPDRHVFKTSLGNIAGGNEFYDVPEDPDQQFESWLSQIEGRFNSSVSKVLEEESLTALNEDDRSSIAFTVIIQELRTLERREFHREMFDRIHQIFEGETLGPKAEKQFEELKELKTDEGVTRFQREVVKENAPELADILQNLKWILFKNETESPFWTSDHPILRYNEFDHGLYGGLGLENRGIQVYLPLSPTLVLSFTDPEIYGNLPSVATCHPQNVLFLNQLQIQRSTRHVIADSNNFQIADEFLEEHPEFADVDRQRTRRIP